MNNVRESRPSETNTSGAPTRGTPPAPSSKRERHARWAIPLLAVLLLLLAILAVRPPQTGSGAGHAPLASGQNQAGENLEGSTTRDQQDLGGQDNAESRETAQAGQADESPVARSPQQGEGLIRQSEPSADTNAATSPQAPIGNDATAATNATPLPALGFSTNLAATPRGPSDEPSTNPAAAPAGDPATGTPGTPGTPGLASFFGSRGHGSRFVYVIDKSGSMAGEPFAKAKRELIRSLRALAPHEHFFVTFYDNHADPMPAGDMLPATAANIESTVDWVRTMSHGGGTDPTQAMTHALTRLRPDTIWLLSDGSFGASVTDTVARHNPSRRVHINTVAFQNRSGEALLKIIAAENAGDYRFVP